MSLTQDILSTWRGPRRVQARFLGQGRNEVRALIFVLIACVLMFVAATPYQAREAQLDPEVPLMARLYWSGFLYIFLIPLLVYALAGIVWLLARVARRQVSGYQIRFTLIWALLAVSPLTLIVGIVAGYAPGLALQVLGFVWLAIFGWFWASGLLVAEDIT